MSRKVFISFLGTNDYLDTHYQFSDGTISSLVRFIQEAAIEKTAAKWTENDAIYIYMTETSRDRNWVDDGQREKPRKGLKSCLDSMNLKTPVYDINIPEGFSEEEIWQIFGTVYGNLQEEDVVYFDVTHAFRSIPLFSTILFNYARLMKGITIRSVAYGAFEKLGSAYDVKANIPAEDRIAPVIDLTGLIKLQQYTELASGLINFGRINKVEAEQLKADEKAKNYSDAITGLCDALCRFDQALACNNLEEFKQCGFYKDFKESQSKLKQFENEVPAPLVDLFESIEGSFYDFSCGTQKWKSIDAAIEWATSYEMLPLAYTLARESLAMRVSELYQERSPYNGKKKSKSRFKDFINAVCTVDIDTVNYGKLTGELKEHSDLVHTLLKEPLIRKLRNSGHYRTISDNRNKINHGLSGKTYKELCEEFNTAWEGCLEILKKNS